MSQPTNLRCMTMTRLSIGAHGARQSSPTGSTVGCDLAPEANLKAACGSEVSVRKRQILSLTRQCNGLPGANAVSKSQRRGVLWCERSKKRGHAVLTHGTNHRTTHNTRHTTHEYLMRRAARSPPPSLKHDDYVGFISETSLSLVCVLFECSTCQGMVSKVVLIFTVVGRVTCGQAVVIFVLYAIIYCTGCAREGSTQNELEA